MTIIIGGEWLPMLEPPHEVVSYGSKGGGETAGGGCKAAHLPRKDVLLFLPPAELTSWSVWKGTWAFDGACSCGELHRHAAPLRGADAEVAGRGQIAQKGAREYTVFDTAPLARTCIV